MVMELIIFLPNMCYSYSSSYRILLNLKLYVNKNKY